MTDVIDEIEELYLQPWQEAKGRCTKVVIAESETIILLQMKGKEYKLHLTSILKDAEDLRGQRISILKTDDTQRPIIVIKMADGTAETTPIIADSIAGATSGSAADTMRTKGQQK